MSEPKRFVRKRKGKVLLGLLNGLGDYFNVDPVIFRIIAIAIFFFSSGGLSVLLVYLIVSLIVPYGD